MNRLKTELVRASLIALLALLLLGLLGLRTAARNAPAPEHPTLPGNSLISAVGATTG